ncbi:hypothetical protein JCM6882_002321 [Rhodosporidiobolus microsporus]
MRSQPPQTPPPAGSPLNPSATPFMPSPAPSPPPPRAPTEEQESEWPVLQEDEVKSALFAARPFAAAGPDGVPNRLLPLLWPALAPRLVPLIRACLSLGHLPSSWRDATCVVLKKPKKPDYSNPKAYRLIAFERCVAKLVESVVARRLAYWAESHLPKEHFGGRKGRSAEEAAACAEDVIRRQWRAGRFVIAAALDAAKAFPLVRVKRLVADMRERGLPEAACRFVEAFMSSRSCCLWFEGVLSGEIDWKSGLPQGSPLSPILFLLYNAGLLEAARSDESCGFGWVDDVNLLAWRETVEEAVSVMLRIVPGLEEWSRTHQTAFEPTKTTVTLFAPPGKKRPRTPPPVFLNGVPLEYSPSLTLLGVELDAELRFKPHIASCAAKAAKALTGVALLARARAGLSPRWVRRLVEAVVMSRLVWASAVWYDPKKQVSRVFTAVQRAAARLITGGYRTSSLAALEVESNLPPLDLVLRRHLHRFALRLHSSAPSHPCRAPYILARTSRSTLFPA